MIQRNEASERQVQAARPDMSTWLAANAGSGKTRVLTDRVARLLLKGVQPQHILCLTYTKAAASEMQNRLFKRLGAWSMLNDGTLAKALDDLGAEDHLNAINLREARTLFARAIETPGGLKIQTIHSFCAALLRRFPLEAGVSPQFTEMEDRAAALIRAEIAEDMARDPQHLGYVDAVAHHVADSDFETLTSAICQHRANFETPLGQADIWKLFDLPLGFDETTLMDSVILRDEANILSDLREILKAGGTNDQKAAVKLSGIGTPTLFDLPILESVFLTGGAAKEPFSAKLGSFPSKKLQNENPELVSHLHPLMQRIESSRQMRLGLIAARKSLDLYRFASAFLPEYEKRKQLRGWLDFDDLILKARQLLNEPAVAEWVLYRLDGGIDHILVDEAQDTSPEQWDVVERLAQEFTSGEGARSDVERTIFVVGDKKQSIYSFQGADPDAFDRMQSEFGNRLRASGSALADLTLEFSFRSSQAILRLVDLIFENSEGAGFSKESQHRAFKSDLPGRVDLWPVIEKVESPDEGDWTDPVDRPSQQHHTVLLAEKIATSIKQMIEKGETLPIDGDASGQFKRRPVQAGDFLILVQRRSDLFAEIIRACKKADLPIAGADRLKVGAELAVKDLAALLGFLSTPEDSLALATALKSPLFGWSEQDLFDLAHRRTHSFLWQALRERADAFPETIAVLNDLRDQTDFLRPYDLIERILTRHEGRRKLLARLGAEAEDGINALLSQALSYERSEIPSLTGFLVWMQTDELEIKRQMGGADGMIRVMTVHGSKGLEAPIVILPDTGKRTPPRDAEIMQIDGQPVWKVSKDQMPGALMTARETAQERAALERQRLLYVALTRAEKWLIVAAAGDLPKDGNSWYQQVETAMQTAGAVSVGDLQRLEHGDWDGLPFSPVSIIEKEKPQLPDFLNHVAPEPPMPSPTISPSDLGGAKALAGDLGLDEEAAKSRGTALHLSLEHLPEFPPADWPGIAKKLVPDPDAVGDILDEATRVLMAPHLKKLFLPQNLAEVPITCELGDGALYGVIDRLIVEEDLVTAVDFKSNATVPKDPNTVPEGLLRQMGAYAFALSQVFPSKKIETAILWTRTAELMALPHDLVSEAFERRNTP